MNKTKTYIVSILISLSIGTASALLTLNNMNIYNEFITPPLSPPSILFPIAWSILYILMGISAAIIYLKPYKIKIQKETSLTTYGLSLFVNFLWNVIFFNLKLFFVSLIWLILLWLLIIKTIMEYYKIDKRSAYIQIPYLLWVSFAGYLNAGIWILNK